MPVPQKIIGIGLWGGQASPPKMPPPKKLIIQNSVFLGHRQH
jgi:hypothetical protein